MLLRCLSIILDHRLLPFCHKMASVAVAVNSKRKLESDQQGNVGPCKKSAKIQGLRSDGLVDLDVASSGTSYYFSGFLRVVYPYFFEYNAFCKGRWKDRKLTEVLTTEFRSESEHTVRYGIQCGNIRVNGNNVDLDYVLRDRDKMNHRIHRHELPVLAAPITIVHEDEEMLVIDKPPSIPVHPAGRYRLNSLVAIMKNELGYNDLFTLHRLDRLTSGLLMFAKNADVASVRGQQISSHVPQKEYLCRVVGDFPFEEVTVDQPIEQICRRVGASIISPTGKPSQTLFKKLSFNGKSSLLHVFPKTGRTHQIRVHLHFLGHPVLNDPLYNTSHVWGPNGGKGGEYGMDSEKLLLSVRTQHLGEDWLQVLDENEQDEATKGAASDPVDCSEEERRAYLGSDWGQRLPTFDSSKMSRDGGCDECGRRFKNVHPRHMMLFLHALRYSGPDWSYETSRPFWANDDYDLL